VQKFEKHITGKPGIEKIKLVNLVFSSAEVLLLTEERR
jgi:hypothetical protein